MTGTNGQVNKKTLPGRERITRGRGRKKIRRKVESGSGDSKCRCEDKDCK